MIRRVLIGAALLAATTAAFAVGPGDPKPAEDVDGKYFDADGVPTFNIAEDGTVDWYTYSGFRRYHAECHVCHGPDGMGSSYAPALAESVANIDYYTFYEVVVNGKQAVGTGQANQVMPAFGTNPNVMCYLDDIYVYLRARAQGGLPRGRPAKKEAKPDGFVEAENACMGG
ncbi:c-type cytochrome, methanol metabolism-related [Acuticoccus sediminis]|uniref:C-type cytochrome, methanol metabolism-related n=1 Tax=Acuticoccus sediminis TaxID=2184697 RepID=A0A8B2NLC1_9HYPH|nr:c-type cytochrome, methanol metabolism-related [Acuticoccus sediminis]RAH99340.1 c-type cytochrome, methanol metabolism-related [Acuticoccus sediminis]